MMTVDSCDEYMSNRHQAPPIKKPVLVHLDAGERQRLARLARQIGATKSDVLRRGLEALARQVFDLDAHPALQIVGLASRARPGGPRYSVAREHDRYLADSEEVGWVGPRARRPRLGAP
jgi:hypothetical protein